MFCLFQIDPYAFSKKKNLNIVQNFTVKRWNRDSNTCKLDSNTCKLKTTITEN